MGFIAQTARTIAPILDIAIVKRVRRNHALEHATVHMLSDRIKGLSAGGVASPFGFHLIANAELPDVEAAAHEALRRLREGEGKWAVHPNCGTSYLTKAAMSSGAALIGSVGMRGGKNPFANAFERLPIVVVLAFAGLLAAEPIGLKLQEHITTCAEVGDLEISEVTARNDQNTRMTERGYRSYFIRTSGG